MSDQLFDVTGQVNVPKVYGNVYDVSGGYLVEGVIATFSIKGYSIEHIAELLAVIDASIIELREYNIIQDISMGYYVKSASMGDGLLYNPASNQWDVSTSGVSSDLEYTRYEPHPTEIQFTYSDDLVTLVTSDSSFGIKTSSFTYDSDGNVTQIDVSKYGEINRMIVFNSSDGVINTINIS